MTEPLVAAAPSESRLGAWIGFVCDFPKQTLAVVAVITAAIGFYTLCFLGMKSDRSDLINPEAAFQKRWQQYCDRFRETNELVVLIESTSRLESEQAADWISREVRARSERFRNLLRHSLIDNDESNRDLGFEEKIEWLQRELSVARVILDPNADQPPLLRLLGLSRQSLAKGDTLQASHSIQVTNRITATLQASLQAIDHSYQSYFPPAEGSGGEVWSRYIKPEVEHPQTAQDSGDDRRTKVPDIDVLAVLLSIEPIETSDKGADRYQASQKMLAEIVAAARQRFPTTEIGITGIPQLEAEEMARSQGDMFLASILSALGVILLLIFGFRGITIPICCCITVGVGLIWTLGAATFLIGHLNILSMAFAAILVGLGIDFGIHLLSSYQERIQLGSSTREALVQSGNIVGGGIITAALTTSVAFLCAGGTEFPGVAELGIIAGVGIILTMVVTFLVFPALVALVPSRIGTKSFGEASSLSAREKRNIRPRVANEFVSVAPRFVLMATLGPCLFLASWAWNWDGEQLECHVPYDANLLEMQPADLPALDCQQRLSQLAGGDVLYAVAWYPDREMAVQKANQFRALGSVRDVHELASANLEHQELSASRGMPSSLQEALQIAAELENPPVSSLPHNPAEVGKLLEQILAGLNELESVISTQMRLEVDHFLSIFARQPFHVQIQILSAAEQQLVRSLWSEIRWLAAEVRQRLDEQNLLATTMSDRLISSSGDWLLQIHPAIDVWDNAGLEQFVTELRTIDSEVTGTPILNLEASRQLRQSYLSAAGYAALAIILIVLVDVSRRETLQWMIPLASLATIVAMLSGVSIPAFEGEWVTISIVFVTSALVLGLLLERSRCFVGLISLLPPIIGLGLLLGLMALLDLPLTPANLIALPLVLGIGIDDGVHVIHDFRKQQLDRERSITGMNRYRMSAATFRALMLTSLTSMIGFGSLGFASHRGLSGLGIVVVLGILACFFLSTTSLPALLALFDMGAEAKEEGQEHQLRQPTSSQQAA